MACESIRIAANLSVQRVSCDEGSTGEQLAISSALPSPERQGWGRERLLSQFLYFCTGNASKLSTWRRKVSFELR
jgi:hypothetical protein